MATSGGVSYGNGYSRNSLRVDKPLSVNSNGKSALKTKNFSNSGTRRSCPASLGVANGDAKDDDGVTGRVRVAVRLRPRNAEEIASDADFADCVELQPELKRLKLRKNNWDSDTYEFDGVLTEFASQKRVYEIVAKPVVESVLDGYNGTVMAYGQTGTGKTYTLGRIGGSDIADRGIMVRAMEDILADVSFETDSVTVSYLQLYMETIQDLLNPANDNISFSEDPKTGDISIPGASLVEITNQQTFLELLRLGEVHRFAANTKLNTESSRSHGILMVYVKRSVKDSDQIHSGETYDGSRQFKSFKPPIVRKAKLVVVDLAGSERINKSGSEGHTLEEAKSINLSLSALGKCINALAENSPHIPVRDSKLTRLLRDSFGGTARTSLVITLGPSPRHRGETASTIMFGQRAMKVENMLKIKEEFDYKSLSRRLDIQLDKLIAEQERQRKAFEDEIERKTMAAQNQILEVERNYANALEKERVKYQNDYMESIRKLEEKLIMNQRKHENENMKNGFKDENSYMHKKVSKEAIKDFLGHRVPFLARDIQNPNVSVIAELAKLKELLQKENLLRNAAEKEISNLKSQLEQLERSEASGNSEILKLRKMLEHETNLKEKLEGEIAVLRSQLLNLTLKADETRRQGSNGEPGKVLGALDALMSQARHTLGKDSENGDRNSMEKLFEQVGLQKILSLLEAEDSDVGVHAVKVVANLAAEETNQQKIVEAGGLTSLLRLLKISKDENIHRVAAGAIANLAMNETNQELIMAEGGIGLLSVTATNAEDPQTLRMVAGAIANLCGNGRIQTKLSSEGGIKALLEMVRCRHLEVLAQVARGIANFAKCESRVPTKGSKLSRSLLIEDGGLPWIIHNANNEASPIRRHIELALCHLAQNEMNEKDMIDGGAVWELVRIARECSREDIRTLALRALTSSPAFKAEARRLTIDYY